MRTPTDVAPRPAPDHHALYDELAELWPLVSHPDEYAEEAAVYVRLFREAAGDAVREVLELGSGGGNNASHMKGAFALTLVEPAPGMRAQSEALNPECTHLAGDMRTVRLGRTFDGVFLHDAVAYMRTEVDLRAALETAAVHLRPGGVLLALPDDLTETYRAGEDAGGCDAEDGRRVRYLEWHVGLIPGTTEQETHYVVLVREPDGAVRVVHDRHVTGVFPRATWLRLLDEVGFDARFEERRFSDGVAYPGFVGRRRP